MWGAGYGVDVHLLRMTIRNLRLKLEAVAPGESYIATEYGLGTGSRGRPAMPRSRPEVVGDSVPRSAEGGWIGRPIGVFPRSFYLIFSAIDTTF